MIRSSVGIDVPPPVITCQSHWDTVIAMPVRLAGGPHATRAHACTVEPRYPDMPARPAAKVGGRRVEPLGSRVAVRTSAYGTPTGGLPRHAVRLPGSAGQAGRPLPVPQTTLTDDAPSFALPSAYPPATLDTQVPPVAQ